MNKKYLYSFFLYFLMMNHPTQSDYPQKMIVKIPISDLREQPERVAPHITLPASPFDNPLQTSQLLLGEYVVAHEEVINKNGEKWLRVNALQQKHYSEATGWQGYPGWILADDVIAVPTFPQYNLVIKNFLAPVLSLSTKEKLFTLSIGTRLQGYKLQNSHYWKVNLPNESYAFIHDSDVNELCNNWDIEEEALRTNIVETAKQFLGCDYSWGGRSAQTDQVQISSSDCSATVHLSYLTQGLQIPRMSHEQFLAGCEIEEGKNLKPGDLIMFSTIPNLRRIDLPHIDHVMMYIGNDMILESTMAGDRKIRIISCKERLGYSIYDMKSGDISNTKIDVFYVYFASYLHDQDLIMQLRHNAVRYNSRLAQ